MFGIVNSKLNFNFMRVFVLKFIWLQKSIAVALDQKISDKTTPLTEFFFWPQHDAWEDIKMYLESKPWINSEESVFLLNQVTEIINEWQDKSEVYKKDLSTLRLKFPECIFVGYD